MTPFVVTVLDWADGKTDWTIRAPRPLLVACEFSVSRRISGGDTPSWVTTILWLSTTPGRRWAVKETVEEIANLVDARRNT